MFNYEEQSKTKQNLFRPQGDDSSENQQKEIVNVTPAILAPSSFDCSFQCCLMMDWHTKHWTCKKQRRKWEKVLHTDSQSNAFCIIQNQCILLLWSRLFRRIILSTGLISFQWIVHHLFVNTFMYLLNNNYLSVGWHSPPSDDILNTPKIEMGSGTWFQFSTALPIKSTTFFWVRSKFHQLQKGY